MITTFLLAEKYGPEIPLDAICEEWFALDSKQAKRRAALQQLPVPVHRLGSQKSTWFIHVADMAAYIDSQRAAGRTEWEKMHDI